MRKKCCVLRIIGYALQHQRCGLTMNKDELSSIFGPLMDPIVEGVIVTDISANVITFNSAVKNIFGLNEDTASLSLHDINGFNLRTALIEASLDQEADSSEQLDIHHCQMSVEFDREINTQGVPIWLRICSTMVDVPGFTERLRFIVLREVSAEKRLYATMSAKESCTVATEDPEMLRLIERLNTVAETDATVLLQGESGTGKTELAKLLHERSDRANKPFIEVNCGAIPETLIETELFGHKKGAFTGASHDRKGRFKAADGGTLFLDEIGELPKELQPKLLRVLQDGKYEPVGSDKTHTVDVRIVSASNKDLREMVDNDDFRDDLYYRIAVIPLFVPSLRERPGDISVLVEVILKRLALRGYSPDVSFSKDALRALMNYPWPGNVRELANAIEHSIICAKEGRVNIEDLPYSVQEFCEAKRKILGQDGDVDAPDQERELILDALQQANGNKTLAAEILDIDRSTLWRRMQKLGMD